MARVTRTSGISLPQAGEAATNWLRSCATGLTAFRVIPSTDPASFLASPFRRGAHPGVGTSSGSAFSFSHVIVGLLMARFIDAHSRTFGWRVATVAHRARLLLCHLLVHRSERGRVGEGSGANVRVPACLRRIA